MFFQAYTNTYGRFKKLESLYQMALEEKDVVGLVIGTRPDWLITGWFILRLKIKFHRFNS